MGERTVVSGLDKAGSLRLNTFERKREFNWRRTLRRGELCITLHLYVRLEGRCQ